MNKILILAISIGLLSGCASNIHSIDQYTQLNKRKVVYRDLTRPVSMDNEPKKADYEIPNFIN
ncbi:hypothetical protein [Pokkaliibacter plantistimulans]|uniref:hypothetical protein n=1 Tax=Pokkaliibacter plantistimulans TaxID=1635171 RepID=UPI001058357A|nr:hypothetical protein [Pokkaliibacter plantistimulans]